MMWRGMSAAALVCGLLSTGCDSKPAVDELPVSGIVTLDGTPIASAAVTFIPDGETKGRPGTGMSGPDGRYSILNPQGKPGLVAGRYKVVVSRMLQKDGTPPPPDVPPADSTAKETLPPTYSNPEKTSLVVTVDGVAPSYDLPLDSRKKK